MIIFISDFSGDEWDEACGTEGWTNAIDRAEAYADFLKGGLIL